MHRKTLRPAGERQWSRTMQGVGAIISMGHAEKKFTITSLLKLPLCGELLLACGGGFRFGKYK